MKSPSNIGSDTTTSSTPASSNNSAPISIVEWVIEMFSFPVASATSQALEKLVIPLAACVL